MNDTVLTSVEYVTQDLYHKHYVERKKNVYFIHAEYWLRIKMNNNTRQKKTARNNNKNSL